MDKWRRRSGKYVGGLYCVGVGVIRPHSGRGEGGDRERLESKWKKSRWRRIMS